MSLNRAFILLRYRGGVSEHALDFVAPLLEAVAHQQAGRWDAAAAGFAAVLEQEPMQPQALFFGGVLAFRTGRMDQALDLLGRSVASRPEHAESHVALGNAHWSAGAKPAARQAWEAALSFDRRHVGALLNLARAQEEAGETEAAVASCRAAVAAAPGSAPARSALASALRADAQFLASLEAAHSAVACDRALAQGHYQLGTTLKALGRPEAAAAALSAALVCDPGDASSRLNLANVLTDLGRPGEAERQCRLALAADPAMAEAHAMLGYLLTRANRLDEAVAASAEAVRLRPELAEGHWNMGIALLSGGDLPGGFAEYEWRKRHPLYGREFRALASPEWDGGPVAGKRLLILAEQGLGDAIMFARYASVLAGAGAEVTIACDRRLVPLLQTVAGVTHAVPNGRVLPAHDLWVDQMSLPLHCGTTVATIPAPPRYIVAEPARAAAWAARLPAGQRRVGVVWGGNPLHSDDANRSCPAALFAPLAQVPDISLVSIQVGANATEGVALGLEDWSPLLATYADTAALVANLDLVVTVDTSVAHLAAAMGKPTWIMVPHCPDWRWLHGRDDSPWYPSVRLFRQLAPGAWPAVIDSVAQALIASATKPAPEHPKPTPP